MTSDNKTLYLCRAPGCGIPFVNQAGRRSHETTIHTDICESFKGQKGEVLHFKNTALRDKAKKKIRDDLKKANGAKPPAKKKAVKKETPAPKENPPAPDPKPHAPAPKDPDPEDVTPPAAAPPAPPATPANPDNSHHNPNPKKKKGFWDEAKDWWEGKDKGLQTQVK